MVCQTKDDQTLVKCYWSVFPLHFSCKSFKMGNLFLIVLSIQLQNSNIAISAVNIMKSIGDSLANYIGCKTKVSSGAL